MNGGLIILLSALEAGSESLPPKHSTICDGRTCRPGEGNPTVTHSTNLYTPQMPKTFQKDPPHRPDSPQYATLLAAARRHQLVILCAADFDYREIAENWYRAIQRVGLSNALVYALDTEVHVYLSGRGVPSVDGSANLEEWNRTRVARHIQRAEAERHLAAAALAAAGHDVLLTEATHVMLSDVTPMLHALAAKGDIDMAVPRGNCDGKAPVGCNLWWNLVFLRGAGTSGQRSRAVAFQEAGVRKGMVDFYLRWWNGAHCMFQGFAKLFAGCRPLLLDGVTAESLLSGSSSAVAQLGCDGTRIGLLPKSFFAQPRLYRNGAAAEARNGMIMRSIKPAQRDRLNLDRYDAQDFDEITAAMKSDGLWFL